MTDFGDETSEWLFQKITNLLTDETKKATENALQASANLTKLAISLPFKGFKWLFSLDKEDFNKIEGLYNKDGLYEQFQSAVAKDKNAKFVNLELNSITANSKEQLKSLWKSYTTDFNEHMKEVGLVGDDVVLTVLNKDDLSITGLITLKVEKQKEFFEAFDKFSEKFAEIKKQYQNVQKEKSKENEVSKDKQTTNVKNNSMTDKQESYINFLIEKGVIKQKEFDALGKNPTSAQATELLNKYKEVAGYINLDDRVGVGQTKQRVKNVDVSEMTEEDKKLLEELKDKGLLGEDDSVKTKGSLTHEQVTQIFARYKDLIRNISIKNIETGESVSEKFVILPTQKKAVNEVFAFMRNDFEARNLNDTRVIFTDEGLDFLCPNQDSINELQDWTEQNIESYSFSSQQKVSMNRNGKKVKMLKDTALYQRAVKTSQRLAKDYEKNQQKQGHSSQTHEYDHIER